MNSQDRKADPLNENFSCLPKGGAEGCIDNDCFYTKKR